MPAPAELEPVGLRVNVPLPSASVVVLVLPLFVATRVLPEIEAGTKLVAILTGMLDARSCTMLAWTVTPKARSNGFHDTGRADAIYGTQTAHAVAQFQREVGLTSDGSCGPQTMKALRKFIEISGEQTPYLLRKAQRIEEYLNQR